jgi:hypothetical protein
MQFETGSKRPTVKWTVILSSWTLFGLCYAVQAYVSNSYFQRYAVWWQTLGVWLIQSYVWALFTPALIWLAQRFPFERRRIWRSLGVHLLAGAFFSVISPAIYVLVYRVITEREFIYSRALKNLLFDEFFTCVLIYLSVVGLAHAYGYYARYRRGELATSELEARLRQSQVEREADQRLEDQLLSLVQVLKVQREDGRHQRKYIDRIPVKRAERITFLKVEDIDWIESVDNYVKLHAEGRSYLIRETMIGLEAKLNPTQFLRVRRSTIVNASRITELLPLFNGEYTIILDSGTKVQSSRRYRKNLGPLLQG